MSDVCLTTSVAYIGRPAACAAGRSAVMARIGSSGPARPAWLKAAAARFCCRGGAYCGGLPQSLFLVLCVKFLHLLTCRSTLMIHNNRQHPVWYIYVSPIFSVTRINIVGIVGYLSDKITTIESLLTAVLLSTATFQAPADLHPYYNTSDRTCI